MFCNCTLAGTKACENCNNTLKLTINDNLVDEFKYLWETLPNTIKFTDWKVFNPETHELVEKKDAKIKRLKDEIAKEKQRVQTCKTVIDAYASNIKEAEDNIKKLNKELSELES